MEGLLHGFEVVFTPANLLFALLGCFVGTLVGVLPGIGPIGAMAVLLGFTYNLSDITSLIMFAGIYYGSMYGGSTTSILLNLPGEASSVVTTLDGHQMARKGRGGAALTIAAVGSFIAGTIGLVLLTFLAPKLAQFALKFGPPEYFAVAVFGLFTLSKISSQALWKSLVMVGAGLLLGIVGLDMVTGQPRMTFGSVELQSGIDFVPLAMGLFGITEVLKVAEENMKEKADIIKVKLKELLPNRTEIKRSAGPCIRGSFLGFIVSLIPGPSALISTFLSYALERKISKHPEEFGKGAPEGVAGPESANNSAGVGHFVPLLSLGIPFSASTAILLSAMMIHGVTPGPMLVTNHPELFWGLIASMYIGNIMLLVLNLPLVGLFVNILRTPKNLLMSIILVLCIVGAFAVNGSVTDVWVMLIAGIVGYILDKLGFSTAPLILAVVIGPMMEDALRQSLLLSHGSLNIFIQEPIAFSLLLLTLAVMVVPSIVKFSKRYVSVK
jgi:putative tricarboxylic transport membrane protein